MRDQSRSHVQFVATPGTVTRQAPLCIAFQIRILEWAAISSSRGSFWPRDQTRISCVSCITGGLFTCWAIREAHWNVRGTYCVRVQGSLCPHRAHALVGKSRHRNSNYDTRSKKHKAEKQPGEAQKDSQGGKDTKRNPEVLRKRKAEVKTHRSA